ncbi:MAG: type II toxin-antitoxin system VapC family toxin [Kiritimatiellae bacterium]|nr:type II toxin-antitoxin system VapC family toxin [Kiritimatiellia bacterium]
MILPDANVLIYAFRKDAQRHREYRAWLEQALGHEPIFGVSDLVLSTVVRVTTHPKIFAKPSSIDEALGFAAFIRKQPNVVPVSPGVRHWEIFTDVCRKCGAKGNLVADAYLAALAIESGSEWITADRDFARFEGLKWRHPLDGE